MKRDETKQNKNWDLRGLNHAATLSHNSRLKHNIRLLNVNINGWSVACDDGWDKTYRDSYFCHALQFPSLLLL